jgi:type III pantothenate kinase
MNFIVDVGNTRVKFAVFDNNHLQWKTNFLLSDFESEFKAVKNNSQMLNQQLYLQ